MARRAKRSREATRELHGHTLYLRNLTSKLPVADLRIALYMLCTVHGQVVALNTHKTPKMRGQAFVAFSTRESASLAFEELQDFEFFGKPIVCEWAKTEALRSEWKRIN